MYMVAGVVLAVGVAFYGGMQYEKSTLASAGLLRNGGVAAAGMNGGNGAQGGQGGQARRQGGALGMGGQGGGFTNGNIIAKDEKSITVKDRSGSSKIVYIAGSTTVGKTAAGSVSDLAVGESVMVTGTASPDGSVAAESIQIRPAAPQSAPMQQGVPASAGN